MQRGTSVPSVMLIHLANISYRLGCTLNFDAVTMTCKRDVEPNRMFTRVAYRAPYVVPGRGGPSKEARTGRPTERVN